MTKRQIAVASIAALSSLTALASPALAGPTQDQAPPPAVTRQYPTVYTPTGQWELTFTWPGHRTEHDLETWVPDPTGTSTFGYQVYRSSECSLDHSGPLAIGRNWAEFYVYPDGMLFSGLRPGNGPTEPGGDMESLSGQAPNDASVPLVFSGPWQNAAGPAGTFTLAKLTRPLLCQITPATKDQS